MKNTLKELRKVKQLTQEDLAKASGISIRTIQRMEKGISMGSPHSIKALAQALEVDYADIQVSEEEADAFEEKTQKLKLMNLSILSVIVIPFGNIIFPFLIFLTNRKDHLINTKGKRILSFQILISLTLPFFMIFIALFFGRGNGQVPLYVFLPYMVFASINLVVSIMTAIRINQGKDIMLFTPNIL